MLELPSADVLLRVRKPSFNASGSILLRCPEGLWDCVECKEWKEVRFTEENWLQRYIILNGVRDENEAKQILEENADEMHYTYKNLRKPNVLAKVNANHCKLSDTTTTTTGVKNRKKNTSENRFEVISSKWDPEDGSLELFLMENIEKGKTTIASTEYTSLLLMFELVVFEPAAAAADTAATTTTTTASSTKKRARTAALVVQNNNNNNEDDGDDDGDDDDDE